jgi:hypothetical protein
MKTSEEREQALRDAHRFLCNTLGHLEIAEENPQADVIAKAKKEALSTLNSVQGVLKSLVSPLEN